MTKRYYNERHAFTLTELGVSLLLLLLVGGIVSKEAINTTKKRAAVEKVQETYNLLEKASLAWQAENNCMSDIKKCVSDDRSKGVPDNEIFNGIAKYLPVVNSSVNLVAKSRKVEAQPFSEIDWLPKYTKLADGQLQTNSSVGVSKFYDGNNKNLSYYQLKDGVTIVVNMVDYPSNTGYGFFDIDGKEGANTIGVDVFPFSIGANLDKDNMLYDVAANKFNPYFSSNNYEGFDLCNINMNICANEKLVSNPTAYVLKWNKLP